MFTQKHYVKLAATLKAAKPPVEDISQWEVTVEQFIVMFNADNPRFNPDRFMAAAGYQA